MARGDWDAAATGFRRLAEVAPENFRSHLYLGLVEGAGLTQVEVLKDADYGAAMEAAAPDEARGLLERTGASREDLVGTVRAVTVRAVKPA